MTLKRLRPIALVAMLTLVVAGCAVPGQGSPGVAAVFEGHVITNADVYALDQAFGELASAPAPGEDLTLLLLGPGAVSIAESLGATFTQQELTSSAFLWMSYSNVPPTQPSAETLEAVRMVLAIDFLFRSPEGVTGLVDLVMRAQDNTVSSPRDGACTKENFSASIVAITDFISQQGPNLSGIEFLAFERVNCFAPANTPGWISTGG